MSKTVDEDLSPDYGTNIQRKIMLSNCDAPLHLLQAHGVEVPHRDINPENAEEFPHTAEIDGTRVHLHQDVRETSEIEFGDFGAVENEITEDDTVWTVVSLEDETVTITVVGDWGRRREIPFEEFNEEYEPVTCETSEGREVPRFGY